MHTRMIASLRTSLRVLETSGNRRVQAVAFGEGTGFDAPLCYGQLHEIGGSAASIFVSLILIKVQGPILCCTPGWSRTRLYPPGLVQLGLDPGRIVLLQLPRIDDLLHAAHEGLRAGWHVVLELDKPLGLTPARRLQLAAEFGGGLGLVMSTDAEAREAPLALSAMTRWAVSIAGDALWPAALRLQLGLMRNRGGPLGRWCVEWDHASSSLSVVSAAGDREDRAAQSAIA
jgi:protein ImuA